jgi:hypothetical protein
LLEGEDDEKGHHVTVYRIAPIPGP